MKYLIGIGFLFTIFGCGSIDSNQSSSGLTISKFTQGKMKTIGSRWVVYEQGNKLDFEVNGECNANGESVPCMWHGFKFKYKTTEDIALLNCIVSFSKPTLVVNPNEVVAESAEKFEYTLELPGTKKTFVNPNYITEGYNVTETKFESTQCFYKGDLVLEFYLLLNP